MLAAAGQASCCIGAWSLDATAVSAVHAACHENATVAAMEALLASVRGDSSSFHAIEHAIEDRGHELRTRRGRSDDGGKRPAFFGRACRSALLPLALKHRELILGACLLGLVAAAAGAIRAWEGALLHSEEGLLRSKPTSAVVPTATSTAVRNGSTAGCYTRSTPGSSRTTHQHYRS